MKESKLMKEVVLRSIESDLDEFSSSLLEEHKQEHHTATVRPCYFTKIAACVAVVFLVGVIAGLVIMKNVLRKDPGVNTAPDIVDSHVSSSNAGIKTPDNPSYYPYLSINNNMVYSRSLTGTELDFTAIKPITVTKDYMEYLNTLSFVGVVNSTKKDTLISSNFIKDGGAVFCNYNAETYYVYTSPGQIYCFGRPEVPDLQQGDRFEIGKNLDPYDKDKIYMRYNGRSLQLEYESSLSYKSQIEARTAFRTAFEKARFLGMASEANADHSINFYGAYVPGEALVYCDTDKEKIYLYYLSSTGSEVYVVTYNIKDR